MGLPFLTLAGFIGILGDLLGEMIGQVFADAFGELLAVPLLYTPGYAILKTFTFGRYPPEFNGETGRIPCYFAGVGFWFAVCGGILSAAI